MTTRPTYRAFWLGILWIGVVIYWIYSISRCFPGYAVDPTQTVNYPELLAAHSRPDSVVTNPLFVFLIFYVGAIIIIPFATHRWLLAGLMLLGNLASCCVFYSVALCTETTLLRHVQTAQFEGHIYHLTRATHVSSDWDTVFASLDLHECDVRMTANQEANELRISYGQALVYTVDADGISKGNH